MGPAYATPCLPTRAQSASGWESRKGKVRDDGRSEGSVAVMVADM